MRAHAQLRVEYPKEGNWKRETSIHEMELFQTAVFGIFAVAIAPVALAVLCGVVGAVLQLAVRQLFHRNLGCAVKFFGGWFECSMESSDECILRSRYAYCPWLTLRSRCEIVLPCRCDAYIQIQAALKTVTRMSYKFAVVVLSCI